MDAHDRGKQRVKRATLVAFSALLVKLVSAVSLVVTVPLTVHYLGPERYGVWMTVSSFVAMMAFADLGMGIGLLNQVADANGAQDRKRMHIAISSAFMLLLCIGSVLSLVLIGLVALNVQFPLIKTSSPAVLREASLAVYVCLACILINLPMDIVQRIQIGLQRGHVTYMWQLVGGIGSLMGILCAVYFRAPLPILVLAYSGIPLISTALNFATFFAREPDLTPSFGAVKRSVATALLNEGVLFCLLQVAASTCNNMDNVILGGVMGGIAVAIYSTGVRLFNVVQTLITMFINALWPAYRESHARGDHEWVRRTYTRSIIGALIVCSIVAPILVLLSPWIIRVWTEGHLTVPLSVLIARGIWLIVDSFVGPTGVLLSSLSKIKFQILLMGLYVLIGFSVKPMIARTFGLSGVAWASSTLYVSIVALPMYWYLTKKVFRPQERVSSANFTS
ncbi:polysaccharide biosynthesis protein [Fimbriimonas ginsengisoli Gsoil 348]|uniref:Polysaccharide biosynthesis protein n=1 Tax=Fimbriimonas ginsengisoli Gsoil 348 TaxID=661478 RepID=A0A068NTJ5_FIMGI|nr:polysaccharide biosynthesis protein [Fimbriimonas ginsengisoli Gsoil 348]